MNATRHGGVFPVLRWLLVLVMALGCDIASVQAQKARVGSHATPTLRHDIVARLGAVERAAGAGNFAAAERLLAALEEDYSATRALNSYERANVYNMRGWIHYTKQEYANAIHDWEQVLEQPDLPRPMVQSTRYSLAQLYLAARDWQQAAALLEAWFELADDPDPDDWLLLAQAHQQLGRNDEALQDIDRALVMARLRSQPPRESWYLLQRKAALAKNDLPAATRALEILVERWPRKGYFVQLAAALEELGDAVRERAVLEAAYRGGWLDGESELLDLAYLYLEDETPIRAVDVIEQGMRERRIAANARNLELLGTALRLARENRRAVEVLSRAARLAADAQIWTRVASLQLEMNDAEGAASSAREALALGGGQRPDTLQILLGTALYKLGRYVDARAAFVEAERDRRSRRPARQWLRFLDAEIARVAQLADEH